MHKIPKYVHINRGVIFDCRLFYAMSCPDERDYKYDFDVFLPTYGINLQRPYVWEHTQQNEFILSILLEKPIDPFIIVQHNNDRERTNTINYVIDGKQRLMTIQTFLHNEFPIIVNGNEYFWNDFGSSVDNLVFIVCGSATSWLVDNIEHNKGGLFNRQTCKLFLEFAIFISPIILMENGKRKMENYLKLFSIFNFQFSIY